METSYVILQKIQKTFIFSEKIIFRDSYCLVSMSHEVILKQNRQ